MSGSIRASAAREPSRSGAERTATFRSQRIVVVVLALVLVLVSQVARTMFPLMYLMGEDWNFAYAGLIAVAVYAAPIVMLPIGDRRPRNLFLWGTVAIGVTRLAVQFLHPIPTWLAMAGTAIALAGTALVLLGPPRGMSHRSLALGVVLGLALDTALRAPYRTWDLVWQEGIGAVGPTLALVGVTLLLAVAVRSTGDAAMGMVSIGGIPALGPFLALQLLFVQNLGFVGSQAGIGYPAAVSVVLAGDALALGALASMPQTIPRAAIGAMGLAATVLAWSSTSVSGTPVVLLILVLQVLLAGLLGSALRPHAFALGGRRTILAVTGASLSFIVLTLLWMIDIDMPLPFPRELVAAVAVGSLAAPGLLAAGAPSIRARSEPALVLGVVVAVSALVLPTLLWLDRRPSEPETLADNEFRVVQYNVRGAVNTDGQIDPDDIARAIASSDPDVVVLQEVARGWPIHGAGDLLARLEQRLDMPFRYEPAADEQFGNAIFSRLPMTLLDAGPLPGISGKQARSYLIVELDTGGDRSLVVVGTHLETDATSQIAALLAAWAARTPAVVAGDMNMEVSDEASVRRFTDAGLIDAEGATGDPCRSTSAEPTSACDRPSWVFVTEDLQIASFRIGTVSASDHLPVHVVLELPS